MPSVASRALLMKHEVDPKTQLWEEVAPYIGDVEPLANEIIVAVYVRPEKTASGMYVPDKSRDEDKFQGKVGLLLKAGPVAFQDDVNFKWGELKPKVGDFICFNVGDTWSFILGKNKCRQMPDTNVKQIIKRPDIVL